MRNCNKAHLLLLSHALMVSAAAKVSIARHCPAFGGGDFYQSRDLAGMVSMLPTTDSSLFKIQEGNSWLARKALDASNATLVTADVSAVIKRQDGSFGLQLKVSSIQVPH